MIKMPPTYSEICKQLYCDPPYTMYLIKKIPDGHQHYYDIRDTHVPGTPRGSFRLDYVLKSFPHKYKDDRYRLFFVTNYGLFVEEMSHSKFDEPIDFRNIYAKFVHEFSSGDIIINAQNPIGSRQILPLYNVKYEEVINGKVKPNSYYYYNHPKDEVDDKYHDLVLYSDNYQPIKITFDSNLYHAIRSGMCYIHLRADNYVNWHNIKTWHPSF